ncbi:MAG TPA: DUF4157 domain-containing protein, partial [Tahibacter sp.]|nr:DUF4157 domain-containing protein [Tahibacter sp.]
SHIVFGAGQFAPQTASGRHLIAHELAHVVQQGGGGPAPIRRTVAPDYVIDDPFAGRTRPGAPLRVTFARDSAAIPAAQLPTLDAFKSGPDRALDLELLGLATEDELATKPTLPKQRVDAVDAELGKPRAAPAPFNTAHAGKRNATAGALANTQDRANIAFNRAVEVRKPGEVSLSPATPVTSPTTCAAPIETAFQAAKTMAFDWIDVTRTELAARPVAGTIAGSLDTFFGSHDASFARRVHHNLGLIRSEVNSLAQPANHDCADPNLPGCVGAAAFNSGGAMTICAGYTARTPEDRARNLVHEAGHSTKNLRIRGTANRSDTKDFSYRSERGIHLLGQLDPDQALSNSDSYTMLLMTQRVPAAITPTMRPPGDPAPAGFTKTSDADKTRRAIALAERWARLASQGLTDVHGSLRDVGRGNPVPTTLGDPRRQDKILAEIKRRFPPILGGATVTGDDLLMIAGVLDRYAELALLFDLPIAASPAAATAFTRPAPGRLALGVDTAFLAANERTRARRVVDAAIELIPTAHIRAARRGDYGEFAEFVRNLFQ